MNRSTVCSLSQNEINRYNYAIEKTEIKYTKWLLYFRELFNEAEQMTNNRSKNQNRKSKSERDTVQWIEGTEFNQKFFDLKFI